MAFRKVVVDSIKFSFYFEGYGLYEDADFSIRALQFGKMSLTLKCNYIITMMLRVTESILLWQNGGTQWLVCMAN
jgi:hypothetical protein